MNTEQFQTKTFVIPPHLQNPRSDIPHDPDYVGLRSQELQVPMHLLSFGTVFKNSTEAGLVLAAAGFKSVGYFQAAAFREAFPEASREQPIVALNARWKSSQGEQRVLVLPMLGAAGVSSSDDTLVTDEGKWEKHATFLVFQVKVSYF